MSDVAATVERALTFDCEGERLVGVISAPAASSPSVGVVIVVGGPQYRAGSHRQFVALARHLAGAGFIALRFDMRGMGDSSGALGGFEQGSADIAAAIDELQRATPGLQRVALWGLCDGASAALLYVHERADARVAGLALLNPWVRSEASLAKTQVKHYYRARLMQRAFWLKLLSGKVALAAVAGLWRNLRLAGSEGRAAGQAEDEPFALRMAAAWARFDGPILLMLSEQDYTAREFVEVSSGSDAWRDAFRHCPPRRVDLPGADHTCSQPAAKHAVHVASAAWLAGLAVRPGKIAA